MQDHVRKLDFVFDKPDRKSHKPPTYTTGSGGTAPDFITKKNNTPSDPYNQDIHVDQHGDNVTTEFEHMDNPFQQPIVVEHHTQFHVGPKFSRGKGKQVLFALILFICAAIIATFMR